ncbi:MAG: hypothetical protein II889_05875 [Clostridia bacterium]|nr:hypothetical protein [Clostridia bacterium]
MPIKRITALFCALLLLLSAGCRKDKPEAGPRRTVEVYILPANWEPGPIQSAAGRTLSVVGVHMNGDEKICLFTLAEGGGSYEKRELPEMERLRNPRWDGSIFYGLKDVEGERTFVRYDEEGNLLESRPLGGILPDKPDFWPQDVLRQPDGTLVLLDRHILAMVPLSGEVERIERDARGEFDRLFPAPDGEVWVWERTERGRGIARIDRERGRLMDLVFLPEEPPQDWQRNVNVLGFDADGRFLWAEEDGINAVRFDEDGPTKTRFLDYDGEDLDLSRYRAALLSDGRTLVFSRREFEEPRLEGESDAAYRARTGGAKRLTRFLVLRPAG